MALTASLLVLPSLLMLVTRDRAEESGRKLERRFGMDDLEERREAAVKRLKAKRSFKTHLAVYLIVNTLLVIIWAVQGAGR